MKKYISMILITFMLLLFPLPVFATEQSDIISETAVLMDAETGQVLFDKSGDRMMYPASTTKIMTALLAAEKCNMNEVATVTHSAVDIDEWNSSNIALIPDETLPVDSLMYGLMLPSANDAANVLAEHISGNQRDFAQLMTERARSVGAVNTRFANAHGLHEPNHYTTALDLALITREAIKNPVFMQYFGSGTHTIPSTNLQLSERSFTNHQSMLLNTSRYYDDTVVGGKTGYTNEARHTMSTVAVKDGRTLICVVMNSANRDDKFLDTKKLLEMGFGEFTQISVSREKFPGFSTQIVNGENEIGTVDFSGTRDFKALLHNSLDLSALEIAYSHDYPFSENDDITAYAEFSVSPGNPAIPASLGKIRLEPDIIMYEQINSAVLSFKDDFTAALAKNPWVIPLIISSVVFVLFISLFIMRKVSIHMRIKRRRQRLERIKLKRETLYAGPKPIVSSKK